MKRIVLGFIALAALCSAPVIHSQTNRSSGSEQMPSMPSTEEVNDLLGKASEYVDEYRRAFKNAKPTLDKAILPGFIEKADELCGQANALITAAQKNGPTGYTLVALIGVLDDMSLHAARASNMAMMTGLKLEDGGEQRHALQDFQDLAQAEKNCYDISELIMHSTLRLIAVEEQVLRMIAGQKK